MPLEPRTSVREHPAPPGALRYDHTADMGTVAPRVREHPAPSGAFNTLFQKRRSWSSAQVPRGGGLPVLRWRLARARRQRSSGPLPLWGAHTRGPIQATPFAHKGWIKPLCAVLCCVIPSLVCATGTCAPKKNTPPGATGRIRSGTRDPGAGPDHRRYHVGGAPCAATIQGCRGALAAPVGCCTGGGRGCLPH
mgnify:CR=1 FL=1